MNDSIFCFILPSGQPIRVERLANPDKVKLIVLDLFAGAGGVTEGLVKAVDKDGNRIIVVAIAVNHNKEAIESHELNHPNTIHFMEDVRKVNILLLKEILDAYKQIYKNAEVMMWFSAPCQEHSIAKAGQPLNAMNRTLPYEMLKYIDIINPDRIGVENVRQFKDWGPLIAIKKKEHAGDIENGIYPHTELKMWYDKKDKIEKIYYKGDPKRKAEYFNAWREDIKSYGYTEDWTFINAADLGAYTSRDRLFGQFCRPGASINWPKQTHCKKGSKGLLKWRPAKDVLDLEDHGGSIFSNKKRLVENTIGKILEEIKREVSNGNDGFIHKYYGNGINMSSLNEPVGTLRQKDCMYYVKLIFHQYGKSYTQSLDTTIGALATNPKANILTYIFNPAYGSSLHATDKPSVVITASQGKAPLSKLSVIKGAFDADISNFLSKDDIDFLEGRTELKSAYVELLEFCVLNNIRDVRKRGLKVPELLRVQGFPENYKFSGSATSAKSCIGNSVSPVVALELGESICLN